MELLRRLAGTSTSAFSEDLPCLVSWYLEAGVAGAGRFGADRLEGAMGRGGVDSRNSLRRLPRLLGRRGCVGRRLPATNCAGARLAPIDSLDGLVRSGCGTGFAGGVREREVWARLPPIGSLDGFVRSGCGGVKRRAWASLRARKLSRRVAPKAGSGVAVKSVKPTTLFWPSLIS